MPDPRPPLGEALPPEMEPKHVIMTLRGPGVTFDDAVEVGVVAKGLLDAVAKEMGIAAHGAIVSIRFQCDGCGLTRPDRPGPDEGWTYADGDDFCPACAFTRGGGRAV